MVAESIAGSHGVVITTIPTWADEPEPAKVCFIKLLTIILHFCIIYLKLE